MDAFCVAARGPIKRASAGPRFAATFLPTSVTASSVFVRRELKTWRLDRFTACRFSPCPLYLFAAQMRAMFKGRMAKTEATAGLAGVIVNYSTTTFTATNLLIVEPPGTWARRVRLGNSPGVVDSGIVTATLNADSPAATDAGIAA